jgi:hypothetical protein
LSVALDRVGVTVIRVGRGGRTKKLFYGHHPGAARVRSTAPRTKKITKVFRVGVGAMFVLAGTEIRCFVVRARFASTSVGCGFLTAGGRPIGKQYAFEFSDRFVEVDLISAISSSRVFFRRQSSVR